MAGSPTRTLMLLVLGGMCGVLVTVLFLTIDPTFEADETNGAGVGNAVLVLDERILAVLIAGEMERSPVLAGAAFVDVSVKTSGIIEIAIVPGGGTPGRPLRLSLDPNILDGQLSVAVLENGLDALIPAEGAAALLQAPIEARLQSMAGASEYRLVSINTTDRRLTLEISI